MLPTQPTPRQPHSAPRRQHRGMLPRPAVGGLARAVAARLGVRNVPRLRACIRVAAEELDGATFHCWEELRCSDHGVRRARSGLQPSAPETVLACLRKKSTEAEPKGCF
jgi:hypothetical protein